MTYADNARRLALFQDVRVREREVEEAVRRYAYLIRVIVQNPVVISTEDLSAWENDTNNLKEELQAAISRLEEAKHNILGYFRPTDPEAP